MQRSSKTARLRFWIKSLYNHTPAAQVCYYCKKPIPVEEYLVLVKDHITEHHLNQDRTDNRPENLVYLHRSCHNKIHGRMPGRTQATVQIIKDNKVPDGCIVILPQGTVEGQIVWKNVSPGKFTIQGKE